MAERAKSIDVSDIPEVLRLAEEVRRVGEPHVLRKDGEDLAVVMPLPSPSRPGDRPSEEALAATRAAAGSWRGLIDPDALKDQIYAARGSDRPTPSL